MIFSSRHDRRQMLRGGLGMMAGAAGAAMGGGWAAAMAGGAMADVVIRNARVHTMDSRLPHCSAIAIGNGHIIGAGSWDAVRRMAGRQTAIIDAQGQTIVPGFTDAHNHAVGETLAFDVLVGNPFDVEFVTIDSIVQKLAARAAQTPPGQWVEGFFYDDTKIKDGRPVTRADLDRVSTSHPVMITHRGSHTHVVNSIALQLAGITRDTPNPFGGTFGRDANGELNGLVTDLASAAFAKVGKRPVYTPQERARRARVGAERISAEFARYGLTTVHHDSIFDPVGDTLDAIRDIHAQGRLLHRVRYEPALAHVEKLIAAGVKTGDGDDWVRIGAVCEQLSDGSFSERTLSRREPYPGSNPPYYGNITQTQDKLDALVLHLLDHGFQPNFHANGEVAVDMVLTGFERARTRHPDIAARRPKITHCTIVTPDIVKRIKAVGAVPNLFTTYPFYNADKFGYYGADMMDRAMAYRWLIDAGIPVCAGSDFPPGPIAPLMGLQGMVTRKGWNDQVWGARQAITPAEGLRVLTANGAYSGFEEDRRGTLSPGKLADLVFLDADPLTVDPARIKDIKVTRTLVGGQTVFKA